MTNCHYTDISQYQDLESVNAFSELVNQEKIVDQATMLKYLAAMSRDNARTPMQWDTSTNAGFSQGTPWMAVNPNYQTINAADQVNDPDSVFGFYQQLIKLRHSSDLVVYGDYQELDPADDQVFAYRREYQGQKLLVISNFTTDTLKRDYGQTGADQLVISNYHDDQLVELRPYEAKAYLLNE
ncbi:alpha-glucosidase C-terminal domain-containing protein [Lentilactobacillus rapi]|nr:alpha-glucosidase C-terminal domain-containing protein [Lentilactobacillus rapi]